MGAKSKYSDDQRVLKSLLMLLTALCWVSLPATSQTYDDNDPVIDGLVDACLKEQGVRLIGKEKDVACFNTAIFPSSFFAFNELPETELTVYLQSGRPRHHGAF